jgi:REP element-mobilizing transposase RayT
MARKPRAEYAGATYHVMSRGNRSEAIFRGSKDCERFLDTLDEVTERNGWLIHAFVLMGNHYHLLLETPEPNLVDGMRWLQGTYTQRFNARYKIRGHLFQGRYKALPVDGGEYFRTAADYVHLNPARAHCFDLEHGCLADYKWSSYCGYVQPKRRPGFLRVDRVLATHGFLDDQLGRSHYSNFMQKRIIELSHCADPKTADEQWRDIRRGWAFGSEEFRLKIQNALDQTIIGKRRDSFMGEAMRRHDEHEAERLLERGLEKCGIAEKDLEGLKKGDARKKVIAWLIRRNTSVKTEWITSRLKMGTTSNLARYIRTVEESSEGHLLDLKNKMMNEAD